MNDKNKMVIRVIWEIKGMRILVLLFVESEEGIIVRIFRKLFIILFCIREVY